jgi:outer membrane protein TolC
MAKANGIGRWVRPLRCVPLALGFLAWPLVGCAEVGPSRDVTLGPPIAVRAAADEARPQMLPAPTSLASATPAPTEAPAKRLPIDLDTVFRLAEGQNAQIALARERVAEAHTEQDLADLRWLPETYVGAAYHRHEGGDQFPDGRFVHSSYGSLFSGLEVNSLLDVHKIAYEQVNAERKMWQQKGELSRISYETLLDATQTYIDLLAAYEGRDLAKRLQRDVEDLLRRAQDLYNVEKSESVRMEVTRLQSELAARKQTLAKLREQAASASAKLAYLLGLDPCTELVPLDARLTRLELVDATPPCCDLVSQALANGPGVRELEGMLTVIMQGIERSKGPGKFLPIFELHMAEGGFGAGPGDQMTWDNRWDLCLAARWNLTDFCTARDRERLAESKLQQVHLTFQDLRGKLAEGVEVSQAAIHSGDEEIRHDDEQIRQASATYDISNKRLQNRIQGSSYGEVLLSLQGRALAELNKLQDIRAYDKAQLRLLLLLGPSGPSPRDGRGDASRNPACAAPHPQ